MPVSHKESTSVDFQESTKADFLLNSSLSCLCREERCNYNIYIEFDEALLFCLLHAHAEQKTQKSGYYALVLQLLCVRPRLPRIPTSTTVRSHRA